MSEPSAASILAETVALLRRAGDRGAVALRGLTAAGSAIDLGAANDGRGSVGLIVIQAIANLLLFFWVTTDLLRRLGLRTTSGGGLGASFGVAILTGLGVIAGLVLLIVPGIYLGVRCSISGSYALADGYGGVGEAIGRSWRSTRGRAWSIFVALLPWHGLIWGGAGGLRLVEAAAYANVPVIIALDALSSLGVVAAWYAAVAIYELIEGRGGLSEIFE